ncbi:MAG: nucleotide exchange factor GrpE [Candidatus Oxydemutatoraceae bacterium WSBS_2016_MAG_OTU14]
MSTTKENKGKDEHAPDENKQAVTAAVEDIAAQEAGHETIDNQEEIQDEASLLKQEVQKNIDLWMRARADVENVTKKATRDVQQARLFAIESFAKQLLEVKDNLERSLALLDNKAQDSDFYMGIELTLKLLTKAFEEAGLSESNPQGQDFNPAYHQAMQTIETDEYPPNTIMQVIQKGYMLKDRLIRPALVVVSKNAPSESQAVSEKQV